MSGVNNLEYTDICGITMDLAGSSGFPPASKIPLEEYGSHSPSEDGNYLQYPDIQKSEPDVEGESFRRDRRKILTPHSRGFQCLLNFTNPQF
jgi:hypothetical protein